MELNISFLSLLIGKLSLNTNLVDSKNGFLNLNVTFSVFSLFSGSDPLPKDFH